MAKRLFYAIGGGRILIKMGRGLRVCELWYSFTAEKKIKHRSRYNCQDTKEILEQNKTKENISL